MAILNLAGNFQPASISSGNGSPKETSRAPSTTVSSTVNSVVSVAETNSAAIIEPTTSTRNENQAEVESQIENLRQFNQNIDRSLKFEIDDDLGVTIVRVVDKETDELIRQFPPEELLNLSRRLKELNEQNTGNVSVFLEEKV